MDAAARVLNRLDRLERLAQSRAPPPDLLREVLALVDAADAWARTEGDDRAVAAVRELRRRTAGMS